MELNLFLGPFRDRNFRLIWIGQSVSSLGNAMYRVTLAWSVYRISGSSADMGFVLAVNVIPQLLLTLLGGAVADRLPRRKVILACDLVAGGVTSVLAFTTHINHISIMELIAASLSLGIVSSFFGPAYNPIYRNILAAEDQLSVSAISNITQNCTSVCGPLLASLAFSIGSPSIGFGVDAATFFFSAGCTLLTAISGKARYQGTLANDVKAGLRYVLEATWLRDLISISLIANFACIAPLFVLLPAVIEQSDGGGKELGIVTAVQTAAGAVFSLLVVRYGHRTSRNFAVYSLATAMGGGVALLGVSVTYHYLIFPSMIIIGLGFAFNVVVIAMFQERVPEHYLSRVYSVDSVISFALTPVSYALVGALARVVGNERVLIIGGALIMGTSLAFGVFGKRRPVRTKAATEQGLSDTNIGPSLEAHLLRSTLKDTRELLTPGEEKWITKSVLIPSRMMKRTTSS